MTTQSEHARIEHAFCRVAVGTARAATHPDTSAHCWALALTHLLGWLRGAR